MTATSNQLLAQTNLGTFEPPSPAFNSATAIQGNNSLTNMELIISNLLGIATVVAGVFFIYSFIMGGLNGIGAGGDQGKITKAREQMTQAAVGLVVVVISYAVIGLIGSVIGLDLLEPAKALGKLVP